MNILKAVELNAIFERVGSTKETEMPRLSKQLAHYRLTNHRPSRPDFPSKISLCLQI